MNSFIYLHMVYLPTTPLPLKNVLVLGPSGNVAAMDMTHTRDTKTKLMQCYQIQ